MNTKYASLLAPFLLFAVLDYGQDATRLTTNKCGTMQRLEQRLERNQELKARFAQQQETFTRLLTQRNTLIANEQGTKQTISIPVVFHIVTANPAAVTDAQIQAQLDALNKDFFGANGDSTKIPSYFKPLFGKSAIQFCLAQRTSDDETTTGILRKTSTLTFTTDDAVKHETTGGSDAWNTDQYFNVWLCSMSGGVLGYATFPNDGSPTDQGVVIDYRSLPGGTYTQYNGGKTLTHETGHYFNLYHIWGDDNGTCTGTDYVDNTPNQADPTQGCYAGVRTDNCTASGNGIMYQNYMDYSYDACLVMFTAQQVGRMEAALSLYRSSLLSSTGCQPVVLRNYDAQLKAIVNPAQRVCASSFTPSVTVKNKGLQSITSLNISTTIDGQLLSGFTWTGSLASSASQTVSLPPVTIAAGVHSIAIAIGQVNGVSDEDPSNNTIVQSVQYFAPVSSVTESFEGGTFPPAGWDVVNADEGITWQSVSGIAKTGTACVLINNFENSRVGEKDDLRLPTANLAATLDSAFLSFQVAAATYSATTTANNVWDTLEVLISTDCGQTYTSLYKKWASTLVTRSTPTTTAFVSMALEWRKDSINLSGYIGRNNLLFAFRNTTGFENNIYLDDIRIRTETVNANLKKAGFLVTPNPTSGIINVQFYPQPSNLKSIEVMTSTGQKIAETLVGIGSASNNYSFDLSRFPAGIYFMRVLYLDKAQTKKITKF